MSTYQHPNSRNRKRGHINERSKSQGNSFSRSEREDTMRYQHPNSRDRKRGHINERSKSRGNSFSRSEREENKSKHMTFKRMEQLLLEDSNTICVILQSKADGFSDLLKNTNDIIKEDWIILIVRLVEKALLSTVDMKKTIIIDVCYNFLPHLIKYLQNLPLQTESEQLRNKYYWTQPVLFWRALYKICDDIIMVIPKTAIETLPKLLKVMEITNKYFELNPETKLDSDIIDFINQLTEKLKVLSSIETEPLAKDKSEIIQEEMPFGDFRDLPILPQLHELLGDKRTDIRPNIINGKYISIYHYLDVQFRLLREDFMAPLRDGIRDYMNQDRNKRKKYENIRIYKNVKIESTDIKKNQQLVFVVNLNLPKQLLNRMEYSKRLMHGSLLIFTKDNFRTIILGTLVDKDSLKDNKITVDIDLNTINIEKSLNINFTMVESEIYFEPYSHVLKSLQTMTEEAFPMRNYILNADVESKPPRYLIDSPILRIKGSGCNVLNDEWTTEAKTLQYDSTQYQAFKSALSKEFCVIQGPPGTGKTFIGLEIIETLLENNPLWYKDPFGSPRPILVVCYTNHALDQFLEGVLKITNRVARIGGQSKNANLNSFNIRELRRKVNHIDFKTAAHSVRMEMNELLKMIHGIREVLQHINSRSPVLIDVRYELYKKNLIFPTTDEFLSWLLCTIDENEMAVEMTQFMQIMSGEDFIEENVFPQDEVESVEHKLDDFIDELELLVSLNEMIKHHLENRQNPEYRKYYREYEKYINYLKYRLYQPIVQLPTPPIFYRRTNPNLVSLNRRWALYWQCLEEVPQRLAHRLRYFQSQYKKKADYYETVQQTENLAVLRKCLVVGMTTTGAAKHRKVLEGLKSRIVIVEEAAEVLESHIVTSLTSSCEQLLLIGDHQQLRPSTSVYRLAKDFKLDISLFERMIKNGMHCETLGVQHRMRPEFAQLITPSIYKNLLNHDSVRSFPSVIGMKKNLFFINHTMFEEEVVDIQSKQNNHEALFILQLCRHLILQGYTADDITVLTTYNGQMFFMRKLQHNMPLIQDVRITVVDNFQGEESKIILLSLVRSNKEKKIGFLSTSNRICVALSRAKEGFYIMGNMDNLLSNTSSIWPEINKVLEENASIGMELTLQCKIHGDQENKVMCADDFKQKCPEGGCSLNCNLIMPCGHQCVSLCHVSDRDHVNTKCLQPCSRQICEREHQCPSLCYQKCDKCVKMIEHILPCLHTASLYCHIDPATYKCQEMVDNVKLPCGHENRIRCSDDPNTVLCTHPCVFRLDCGHACMKRCHIRNDPEHLLYECRKRCAQLRVGCSLDHACDKLCYEECNPCDIIVEKQRSNCPHKQKVKCSQNIDDISCEQKCTKTLQCGHPCEQICGECDPNRCKIKVNKTIPLCGHAIKMNCGELPKRKYCQKKCPLKLACGHGCSGTCSVCDWKGCSSTNCTVLVPHSFIVDCNHEFMIPCFKSKQRWESYSQEILKHCTNPCNTLLECGHLCTGTCGECLQGRVHKPCGSQCGYSLVCGHQCKSPCRQNCPPCNAPCQSRCVHSKCQNKCGAPCTTCKEPCPWKCKHFSCKAKCGNLCTRLPCNEPCLNVMKCGHPCIGLCGESCPNVCRICAPENDIFQVFFGEEDEEASRFIKLDECSHIFEVNGLDMFFHTPNEHSSVDILKCPKCRTPIVQTLRYSNIIKQRFMDIANVKKKTFGHRNENIKSAEILRDNIIEIIAKKRSLDNTSLRFRAIEDFVRTILRSLVPTGNGKKKYQKVKVTAMELALFDSQLGIIDLNLDILIEINKMNNAKCLNIGINHVLLIVSVLERQHQKLNKQQYEDLILETNRLIRLREYTELVSKGEYKSIDLTNNSILSEQEKKLFNSIQISKKFTHDHDQIVKENLLQFEKSLKVQRVVSDETKRMIVRALQQGDNVKQGAWYKCPNGHLYCIGECGGAEEIGKCIECKAAVGGGRHRVLEGNQHTREMDGGGNPWPPV